METEKHIIIAITSYKLMSLLIGFGLSYMGYKLFITGVWGDAGGLEAQLRDSKLVLKRAAPGTFFALFGVVVICFTIFKGLEFKNIGNTVSSEIVIDTKEDKENELPKKLPF